MLELLKAHPIFPFCTLLVNLIHCYAPKCHWNVNLQSLSLDLTSLLAPQSCTQMTTWLLQLNFSNTKKPRLSSGFPFKIWTFEWMALVHFNWADSIPTSPLSHPLLSPVNSTSLWFLNTCPLFSTNRTRRQKNEKTAPNNTNSFNWLTYIEPGTAQLTVSWAIKKALNCRGMKTSGFSFWFNHEELSLEINNIKITRQSHFLKKLSTVPLEKPMYLRRT